jgi:hypothetical protein
VLALAGCGGGTKLLKEPVPLPEAVSLENAMDRTLEVTLDWVIVRDGPGTWAKNADWDEYRLRVANLSGGTVRIAGIAIVDSLDFQQDANADRKQLVKASRAATNRYKGEGLTVKAGIGGGALMMAAGVATYSVAASAATAAAMAGSTAAAGTALAGVFIAPVLVTGGIMRSANSRRVGKEIALRQTDFPFALAPGNSEQVTAFFPLAPSPKCVVLSYVDATGEHQLILDTSEVLDGLHIKADSASQAADAEVADRT